MLSFLVPCYLLCILYCLLPRKTFCILSCLVLTYFSSLLSCLVRCCLSCILFRQGLKQDVCKWCRECHPCQASKIHCHVQATLTERPLPDCHFGSLHIDLVGLLDESEGMKYFFKIINRFTRWPEAIPLPDAIIKTCAKALIRQ